MTHTGTSHFESIYAARAYYATTEGGKKEGAEAVTRKLAADEIHIGPPKLKPGQTLSINREEGRYFITEK